MMQPVAYSYIRFSSPEQMMGGSVARQKELSADFCRRHSLWLDESLKEDLGQSAFHGRHLAAGGGLASFLQMIQDGIVKPGSWLVVESVDRLSRAEVGDALELFLGILKSGVTIATTTPERIFPPETRNNIQALLEVLFYMSRANEESFVKAQRTEASWVGRRKKATKSCPVWLRPKADGSGFDVIEERAAVARRIVRLVIEGFSIKDIVRTFEKEGVKPINPRMAEWGKYNIGHIVHNRALIGEYQPGKGRPWNHRKAGDPIPGYYPAIVTPTEWYAAQAAIRSRRTERGRSGPQIVNILKGLIFEWDEPHRPLTIQKHRSLRPVTTGPTRGFPYPVLERAFLGLVRELRPEEVGTVGPTMLELEAAVARDRALATAMASLHEQMLADPKNAGHLAATSTEMARQRAVLTKSIEEFRARVASDAQGSAVDAAHGLLARLDACDSEEDRRSLRTRIKAAIKRLVSRVNLRVGPMQLSRKIGRGPTNEAEVQIVFHDGKCRYLWLSSDGTARTHACPPVAGTATFAMSGEADCVWLPSMRPAG